MTHHAEAATGSRQALRKFAAAVLALQTLLGSATPVWAQRRRGEPEANPQFQQQMSSGQGSGGPVGEAGPAEPEAGAAPESPEPVRAVQGVQIGTVSQAKPAGTGQVTPLETRVTVRVKGAPLATFLDTISAQAKVNFIITEGLETKRVTAFLQNVTVREALQVLLEIKGLTYQQIGKSNTYVVAPRSKAVENVITRIYTLSFIPLIPVEVAAGATSGATPTSAGGGGSGGAGGGSSPGGGGGAGKADTGIAIIDVLQSVLSKSGHVAIEPRTNALIVTDIPETFPQVEQIIQELDKKAPQVMIEAQIVEIDSNRSKDLGFEWGGQDGEIGSFTAGRRDTAFPLNMPRDVGSAKFFDPVTNVISGLGESKGKEAEATNGTAANAGTIFGSSLQTSILDLTALKITLRALVARSEARFLGKPKILTLNNKSAVIAISSNEAVGLQVQSGSVGTTGASTTTGAERVQTGLVLKVTPQINKEGYITMLIQPSFTNVKESSISSQRARFFDPISRGASTMVRIRNAQTLVMGGLLQSNETKLTRKVPILGYIPLLGWLFTSTSSRRANTDLVIFITPTIVSD
ncbi:MAG: secretin N-terminal domain-containing protein [Elusimicrobiota bacterium]